MKNLRLVSVITLMSIWQDVLAQPTTETTQTHPSPIPHADVMQWLWALLAVLAVFAALVWLLRKSGALSFANKSELAILAGLSLGVRERLVLIKVGEKQLLLGITPGKMTKLLELEGEQRLFQSQAPNAVETSFAQKLQHVLKGQTDA